MKLFFRKVGEGRPLIILHGLFGMSDNWMTLSKQFAENNFTVYLPDARNHGHSPHSEDFNYSVMAEDLLELMNGEQISSASLIGHSMGGKTAMLFATKYPQQVEKLVVADMSPRQYPPANDNVIKAIRSVDLHSNTSRKEAEARLRSSLSDEPTIQFLLKSLYWKESLLAWRFNIDAIGKNHNATGEALNPSAVFNGDTLFVRGEKSNYITREDEPLIKKHFPRSTLVTIPGAGHWIHADNPKAFMEVVMRFLN